MARIIRNQTKADFVSRLGRCSLRFHKRMPSRLLRDRNGERVRFWATLSFLWTWIALTVATDRAATERWLKSLPLPAVASDVALTAIAAGLAISFVLLIVHVIRGILRAKRYYNSGAILIGFCLAVAFRHVPEDVLDRAYAAISDNPDAGLSDTNDRASFFVRNLYGSGIGASQDMLRQALPFKAFPVNPEGILAPPKQ